MILKRPTITTFTGKTIDLLNPKANTISIKDIAHGLSLINRYVGQTIVPYSVGQHCLLVSFLAPEELKLDALLHDSTEMIYGDLLMQLKSLPEFAPYKILEDRAAKVIAKKFKINYPEHPTVKKIDKEVVKYEKVAFLNQQGKIPKKLVSFLMPENPENIEKKFLTEFYKLRKLNS
jgi:5'-deoxynucleotidase YfbR-like HD superfamily hydrolase